MLVGCVLLKTCILERVKSFLVLKKRISIKSAKSVMIAFIILFCMFIAFYFILIKMKFGKAYSNQILLVIARQTF